MTKLLNTDYTDSSWQGLKKYIEIKNSDNTVSFQDVTQYQNRERSFFGAKAANAMNEALNRVLSAMDNGTNLYQAFSNYFETQKRQFEASGNQILQGYNSLIESLKGQTSSTIETAKQDYINKLKEFEKLQQAVFNSWYDTIRGQLSHDQAGNLQNNIDKLTKKMNGFVAKNTAFSKGGKIITETDSEQNKLITEFEENGDITQRYYNKENVPMCKKVVKFLSNGDISEEVTDGVE